MTTPVNTSTNINDLSNGNTAGTRLGQTSTDPIAFFGNTPVPQPPSGASIAVGLQSGSVITYSSSQSPASVATLTTAELGMTLVGGTGAAITIATGDLLVINKPTSQASLGIGNVRISSAGVAGVTFSNISAGFLTPTTTETYAAVALRGLGNTTAVLTPAAVAADSIVEQTFTVAGLRAGLTIVNKPTSQPGLDIVGVRTVTTGTLGVTFMNTTASTVITPTAGESYTVISLGGLNPLGNDILYQVSGNTIGAVATLTTAQANVTLTNLAVTDVIKGVSKPTNQAGLIVGGSRVSAAGFVGITFGNFTTASITPTAGEVYEVSTFRPNPLAPLLLYAAALAPTSVAANVMAEQTFTVTGLVAGTPVWVNKPSATTGLGIAGVRVSALNTLAINYVNTTSAAIVPPAETYVVGNFQLLIDAVGNSSVQSTSGATTGVTAGILQTALRTLGLVSSTS